MRAGDRCQYAATFLRSTGQYTGEEPPTSSGPFARGRVIAVDPFGGGRALITVRWDDGRESKALDGNLSIPGRELA